MTFTPEESASYRRHFTELRAPIGARRQKAQGQPHLLVTNRKSGEEDARHAYENLTRSP